MSGHEGVRRLLAEYCHLVDDDTKLDEIAELFTIDAELAANGVSTGVGREGIRTWFANRFAQPEATWRGKHLTLDARIDLSGTTATVSSDWVFLLPSDAGPSIIGTGRYEDRTVLDGNRWRFAARDIVLEAALAPRCCPTERAVTRLPFPDLGDAPASVQQFFERAPFDLAVMRMAAHASDAFDGWLALGSAILLNTTLDPVARELAICATTRSDSPGYEYAHHRAAARLVGITDAQLEALDRQDHGDPSFTERERAVLAFCDEVVRRVRASDATLAAIREHLTDRQVIELLLCIGLYQLNCRIAENSGVTLGDDRVVPVAAEPMADAD